MQRVFNAVVYYGVPHSALMYESNLHKRSNSLVSLSYFILLVTLQLFSKSSQFYTFGESSDLIFANPNCSSGNGFSYFDHLINESQT